MEVPLKEYSAYEIVFETVFVPEFAQDVDVFRAESAGTTKSTVSGDAKFVRTSITKRCLANLFPWLGEMVAVTIPDVGLDGRQLDIQRRMQALWLACERFGVPLWTQSGGKGGTYYFVSTEVFSRLSRYFPDASAEEFTAYVGLLWSEVTGAAIEMPHVLQEAHPGADGNGATSYAYWPTKFASQVRGVGVFEEQHGELGIASVEKGQIRPFKNVMGRGVNKTHVKLDSGRGERMIIALNESVSSRTSRQYVSFEVRQILRNNRFVRKVLVERTKREVREMVKLLTPEKRLELIQRLGGLQTDGNGVLEPALRTVISALRSAMPWCAELESRLGRFALREIAEKIIPSAGIWGWSYLLYQDDEHGVRLCSKEDAVCFAVRLPCPGPDSVAWLPRNPKGLVHSEVAEVVNGDSDGDRLIVVTDPEIVDLFKHNLISFKAGGKPAKRRNRTDLSRESVIDLATKMMADAWRVGAMTLAQAKFLQLGMLDEAGLAGKLANSAPMLFKYDVLIDGEDIRDLMSDLLKRHSKLLKETSLQWREKMLEVHGAAESPRDLVEYQIDEPKHLGDVIWHVGIDEVKSWADETVVEPLSMAKTAKILLGEKGTVIRGKDARAARSIIVEWGQYWGEFFDQYAGSDDMPEFVSDMHQAIIKRVISWGTQASAEALASLSTWVPSSGGRGFFIKWLALGTRMEEVFGLHQVVRDYLQREKGISVPVNTLIKFLFDEDLTES